MARFYVRLCDVPDECGFPKVGWCIDSIVISFSNEKIVVRFVRRYDTKFADSIIILVSLCGLLIMRTKLHFDKIGKFRF